MSKPSRGVGYLVMAALVASGALTLFSLWRQPTAARADERLLGAWRHESDGRPLVFKPDGTVEGRRVTTLRFHSEGVEVYEPVRREEYVAGEYRLAGKGTLEMTFPDLSVWVYAHYLIEGNRLTILQADGRVDRYARALPE